mgnify:CR=1 FL=1
MKKLYNQINWAHLFKISVLIVVLILSTTPWASAQVLKGFTDRMPVERVRGDFELIGNKNISVVPYDVNVCEPWLEVGRI